MASKQENGIGNLTREDNSHSHGKNSKKAPLPFRQKISSWRWMTSMIVWFGFISSTLMRNSFNMALVCMTGSTPPPRPGANLTQRLVYTTNVTSNASSESIPPPGEFDWDEATQGIILSSVLYFGFMAPAISGLMSKKFGAKKVVGISMTISSVMNLLTPFGARGHMYLLIAMRVVIGCFSGTILPATQELWGHWAPDEEKVQLVSWTLSGVNIGSLVSSLISGFLCTIPLDNGWPFVFYVFGGLSLLWCLVWWLVVYDTPDEHKWISEAEKKYIKANIRTVPDKSTFIPYKSLLTSVPLWAFICIQTVHMWCATIFFTYLPKYMRDVLRFPIEQNAIVSSVPFASRFLGVLFWGVMADQMSKRNISTTVNRKVIQSTGFLTCAAITVGIGYIGEDRKIVGVVLFVVTMFFQSCSFAASSIVPLDIAPRLASVITGMFVGVGAFVSIFAPITVSSLTPDGTLEEWRSVFFMIIGCYVFGVTVFVIFGSAELQPWGKSLAVAIIHPPDKSNPDVTTNGKVSHDAIRKGPPRVLIEREVSVISTHSMRSIQSNASAIPAPIIVKSTYYLEETSDVEDNVFVDDVNHRSAESKDGRVNYGYVNGVNDDEEDTRL
ncbi:uncharacterized transporter slc-17.2-like [Haliotis rufescens]|uniref:uncharacterized transporter slc-17.2-like n=1 Tax=Haliotis rufescens TaxID=6454 RepID=UPI00201F1648|nr:uncharacterized transporter slc-17.2-like [Haliotis rufescens]